MIAVSGSVDCTENNIQSFSVYSISHEKEQEPTLLNNMITLCSFYRTQSL